MASMPMRCAARQGRDDPVAIFNDDGADLAALFRVAFNECGSPWPLLPGNVTESSWHSASAGFPSVRSTGSLRMLPWEDLPLTSFGNRVPFVDAHVAAVNVVWKVCEARRPV